MDEGEKEEHEAVEPGEGNSRKKTWERVTAEVGASVGGECWMNNKASLSR